MSTESPDHRFESTAEEILANTWEFYPSVASSLGLHEHDGRLPDISSVALSRREQDLERGIQSLDGIEASSLEGQERLDLKLLTLALRKELFELAELRTHESNPIDMLGHIEFTNYVKRDYAPLEQRVESLTRALDGVPSFLESLRGGLGGRLSEPVLEASMEAYSGLVSHYDTDLSQGVEGLSDGPLRQRFEKARTSARVAVNGFVGHLRELQDHAVEDFAIGERNFLTLLELGEMVDLPVERLLEVGIEDLARNLARFRHVASEIDSRRSPAEVLAEIAADHPTAESILPETTAMLEDIRQFLIDRDIVAVPSEVRCQTAETPAFMRWAFAAMDLPGPFETKGTEAYYYVTPVEEGWTERQKEEWLTSFNYSSLRNISVHEAYPGHYVHYLHTRSAPSKVSKALGAYSFLEGWGHYTEEMMMEEGYGGGDPRLLIGQLDDALLRDCRFLCAIRMHTQGMTVEDATRFFIENAYLAELPARKEALRGTFDPMYMCYTLGKLMILKLREDYRWEMGDAYTSRGFHDKLLSFGTPPIPLVREMMLREPGGDVL